MCRAMNRSFISVIAGGFGTESSSTVTASTDQGEVQAIDIDEFKNMITSSKKNRNHSWIWYGSSASSVCSQ